MNLRHAIAATLFGLAASAGAQVTYLNGGVGEEEVEAMRQRAHEFPLRITFAAGPRNAYTAYVPVEIWDARGKRLLAVSDAGPMLYVTLPPGRYVVMAESEGVVKTQQVTLAQGHGRDVVFHWRGDTGPPM